MTREDLVAQLAAIRRALDEPRTEIWCSIIERDGTCHEKRYIGSFIPTRDPRDEAHHEERKRQ